MTTKSRPTYRSNPTTSEYYRRLLRQRFAGRKVILAQGMVAGSGKTLATLRSLDAQAPLLLAEGIGTGQMPEPDELTWKIVSAGGLPTIMDNIRAHENALANPSEQLAKAVNEYDPDGTAIVVGALFSENLHLLGRPLYGRRMANWCALEDKVIIDALWDELGVARAACEIVASDETSLRAAAKRLDHGHGTVWAGDARDGWHGGAELTRWVCGDDAMSRVAAFFAARCDRVRVMPFLEGIPCSIHGIVFPGYVVALRPVESVTLRRPELDGFRYCGCATMWDPPDADREQMRMLAKHVGAALRDRVDFRGTFTIDGVMTADGFMPTELNPRYGAGINALAKAFPELPTYLVHLAVCEGEPWEFAPQQLETMIIDSADALRTGHCHTSTPGKRSETESFALVQDGAAYHFAEPDSTPDATVMIGPAPWGTMVRLQLDPQRTPAGESVAPRFAMALDLCDRELGTNFGPSQTAKSMRR